MTLMRLLNREQQLWQAIPISMLLSQRFWRFGMCSCPWEHHLWPVFTSFAISVAGHLITIPLDHDRPSGSSQAILLVNGMSERPFEVDHITSNTGTKDSMGRRRGSDGETAESGPLMRWSHKLVSFYAIWDPRSYHLWTVTTRCS